MLKQEKSAQVQWFDAKNKEKYVAKFLAKL